MLELSSACTVQEAADLLEYLVAANEMDTYLIFKSSCSAH
jgi:hypothetical protein